MLKRGTRWSIGLGIMIGVAMCVGGSVLADRVGKVEAIPLEELKTFADVYTRVQHDYVEPVTDKKMMEDAIRGMLSGLDPHSTYLDADEYKELREGTTGQFGGLGIEVGLENGFVKVIAPIDDTPAQRAGVKAGDLIIRLDDKPVKGMSLQDAVKIMRGAPGTPIELTIVREGATQPIRLRIKRDVIRVKSVKSKIAEPGYGYLRITSFQNSTSDNVADAIKALQKQGPVQGLVLDLRNNPGGILNEAVSVSDAFLESGLIVYTEGRIDDSKMRFSASGGDLVHGAPMVVLINGGSASASEIVAGALQDHHRAVIMGEKSFGKGSVQTIMPTANGGAVKLTTARYFTPAGRSIQAEGITPDITLAKVKLENVKGNDDFKPLKESDLPGHLNNPQGKPSKDELTEPEAPGVERNQPSTDKTVVELGGPQDYALTEAVNLLKGINIQRRLGQPKTATAGP